MLEHLVNLIATCQHVFINHIHQFLKLCILPKALLILVHVVEKLVTEVGGETDKAHDGEADGRLEQVIKIFYRFLKSLFGWIRMSNIIELGQIILQ